MLRLLLDRNRLAVVVKFHDTKTLRIIYIVAEYGGAFPFFCILYRRFQTLFQTVAGKDILLAIWSLDGTKLLAISGQQGLTINRSADSIEITSKDTQGGWKSKIAGMKEWSIDNDGLYVPGDESHTLLSAAFENSEPICLKVINGKTKVGMFGGLAVITDYPLEAPYDDAMTYSLSLEGMGALTDLLAEPVDPDTMPEGSAALFCSGSIPRKPESTIVRRAGRAQT